MTRRLRALAVGAALLAVGLAVALIAAPSASAHSSLIASTPDSGATLTELPPEFSVTMNETLLADAGDAAFALRIQDADGRYYGDGCLSIVDDTMSTVAAVGAAGDYVMQWQVVSADGHPVSGEIAFSWAPQTADGQTAGSATPPACGELPEASETPGADDGGHHDETASAIPLGDVLWVVGAVLVVAVAVTITLVVTRRRR